VWSSLATLLKEGDALLNRSCALLDLIKIALAQVQSGSLAAKFGHRELLADI
jgi:hypothetical protein